MRTSFEGYEVLDDFCLRIGCAHIFSIRFSLERVVSLEGGNLEQTDEAVEGRLQSEGAVMADIRYVAVPCDPELISKIEESCKKSGLKLGPEVAMRLRKVYQIGPFAKNNGKELQ